MHGCGSMLQLELSCSRNRRFVQTWNYDFMILPPMLPLSGSVLFIIKMTAHECIMWKIKFLKNTDFRCKIRIFGPQNPKKLISKLAALGTWFVYNNPPGRKLSTDRQWIRNASGLIWKYFYVDLDRNNLPDGKTLLAAVTFFKAKQVGLE